jgi:phosphonate transport system substrate-binding protein
MEKSPEARKGMQGLLIDRFVMPQPNLYEPLRNLYNRVDEL